MASPGFSTTLPTSRPALSSGSRGAPSNCTIPAARMALWSRTSLQQRLVKTDGRLVKYARHYRLMLAENQPTRQLSGRMVRPIDVLAVATG